MRDAIGVGGGGAKKRKKAYRSFINEVENWPELRSCEQLNQNTHTHIHTQEDQCEWHRMARMTGPDCAVMRNFIDTHTRTLTHTHPS